MDAVNTSHTMTLRLHGFIPASRANGPGIRAVIWVQGCTLGCPGCFNPETHPFTGGRHVTLNELFAQIVALGDAIEGITVSGGEPLQQRRPLRALLQRIKRETSLSVVVFTGYTWEEVQRMRDAPALLGCIDVLIAGRYDASQRLARELRGSANKTVYLLSGRYTMAELQDIPPAEVIITAEGDVIATGIEPVSVKVL